MKAKTLSVFTMLFTLLIAVVFTIASCGKKEEQPPMNQNQQQNQQQQTQQNTQQQTTQQTNPTDDKKKEEEDKKKKEEEEKKKKEEEEKKKKEEAEKKVDESDKSGVDFSSQWPKKCGKCHGLDGKGKLEGVPDITGTKTKGKSLETLIKIIANGEKSQDPDGEDMPGFKGKLTDEEIKAAAKYVKGL